MATRVEPRPSRATPTPRLVRLSALGVLLVAAAYLVIALSQGGYSPSFQATLGAATWWVVIVGLAFGVLPRGPVPTAALVAGTALGGLALLTALSAGWASDDGRVVRELVRVSMYLGIFCLVVLSCRRGGARPWLLGLALALGVVAALALGSRLFPDLFPEQDLSRFLPESRTRLAFPVNYWNGLAAIMAAAIVLLAWTAANARAAATRAVATGALTLPPLVIFFTSSRGGALAAVAGVVVLLAAARARLAIAVSMVIAGVGSGLALLATRSREALIDGPLAGPAAVSQGKGLALLVVLTAVGAAGVRLLAELPLRRIAPRALSRRTGLVAATVVLAVAVVVGVAAGAPERLDRLTEPPPTASEIRRGGLEGHFTSDSGSGRFQFWEAGWDAFADHPLRGLGAGGYQSWWLQTGSLSYAIRDAHSLLVESLAELGLPGLALVLAFFVTAAAVGIARRLRPGSDHAAAGAALAVLATGVVASAIDWTWEVPAAFVLVVVAVGLLTGPACAQDVPTKGRYGWGLATIGAGFLALLVSAVVLVGEAKLSDSREAAQAQDLPQALADAAAARQVQPWASAPRLQEALIAERGGDLPRASRVIDGAIERAPDDWRLWLTAARIRTRLGQIRDGARAIDRARELNPRSPIFGSISP